MSAPWRRDGDLVRDPNRALVTASVLVATFAVLVALVVFEPQQPPLLDAVDSSWRDLALPAPVWAERVSELLRTLGSGVVMVPLRIAAAIWLIARRRRLDVAAWLLGWALADAIAIPLKPAIGRAHPDGSGASSFPSAHAKTAAQVAVGLVLVATSPSGRRRAAWWVLAVAWIVAMAASRTLLDEHWLSDVVAGSLLGAACAVGSAAAVQRLGSPPRARGFSSVVHVRRGAADNRTSDRPFSFGSSGPTAAASAAESPRPRRPRRRLVRVVHARRRPGSLTGDEQPCLAA